MKRRNLLRILIVVGLILSLGLPVGSALASARTAAWVVSVTYQNVGVYDATVNVDFYAEGNGTGIPFNPLGFESDGVTPKKLPGGAGASFFIGSVSGLSTPFRGSAVMSSDQPLVATVVQFSQQAGMKTRMLSNGYRNEDAASQYLVATALANKFSRTTVFSIQNAELQPVKATVKFYDADNAGNLASTKDFVIPAGSSKYIDMDNTATTGLPSVFNGSAIVQGVINDTTTPANVVAGASELYTNRDIGANFEGLPLSRASNTAYLATAICRRFGLDTYYAVQNADLSQNASIKVQYYDTNGAPKTADGPYSIGPGQKKSITTCAPSSGANMANFTGSAKITSTGAKIVAIGKAQASQLSPTTGTVNLFTAFMGEPQGASKLALPFVRWANDTNYNSTSNTGGKQRAFLAIQNLESTSSKVYVKYHDKAGTVVGSQLLTIPAFSKGNSDAVTAGAVGKSGMVAGEFGYYNDGSFGGAVTIEAHPDNATAKFIAIARVQHPGFGEDYNAVPVQ